MFKKKVGHYALQDLKLLCEWESCVKEVLEIEEFIDHIAQEHLINLHAGDLQCHWKDCQGFTGSLPELRRHILLHAFHTKIKCHGQNIQILRNIPNCTLSNSSRNIIPELPEPLMCCWDACSVEFESPEYFYRHADSHSEYDANEENARSTICLWNGCNRKFPEKYKLKEHLRSHTQEKLIACPTCGGMFSSRTKFFDHIHRQLPVDENDTDNTFICEYCSRRTNSERLLRDHMRCHVNHYKCPYCDMTVPTPSSLKLHLSYRHSDEKPHACRYCEYRCKTENDLWKHLESHREGPSYQCAVEGCTFAARSQSAYRAHHSKVHEGKELPKYSCHLCEKRCTRGNYLTKHLLNHHKFRWPSGHCRFRYRLHDDGFYRLQTVRYESVELSETMMCDSSESIDDPDGLMNQMHNSNTDDTSTCFVNQSFLENNSITDENDASVSADSRMVYLQDGKEVRMQQSAPVSNSPINSALEEQNVREQEPVLINIVDAEGRTSESGCTVLLVKTTRIVPCDQIRSVQLLTKDESGNVVLEMAEIITQYVESEGMQSNAVGSRLEA